MAKEQVRYYKSKEQAESDISRRVGKGWQASAIEETVELSFWQQQVASPAGAPGDVVGLILAILWKAPAWMLAPLSTPRQRWVVRYIRP